MTEGGAGMTGRGVGRCSGSGSWWAVWGAVLCSARYPRRGAGMTGWRGAGMTEEGARVGRRGGRVAGVWTGPRVCSHFRRFWTGGDLGDLQRRYAPRCCGGLPEAAPRRRRMFSAKLNRACCVGSCLRRNDGRGRRNDGRGRRNDGKGRWALFGERFLVGGLGRCAVLGEIPAAGRGYDGRGGAGMTEEGARYDGFAGRRYDGSFARGSGWPFARRRRKCEQGLIALPRVGTIVRSCAASL